MRHKEQLISNKNLNSMIGLRRLSGRDALPISAARMKDDDSPKIEIFGDLFLRALNDNQIFLLKHIDGESRSLNSFLREITETSERSLSTLKLNARILKDLELIDYGSKTDPEPVRLTEVGEEVLWILEECGTIHEH